MRSLPLSKIDHKNLYNQCVAQTHNVADRTTLVSIATAVVAAGTAFAVSAEAKQCHSVTAVSWTPNEKKLLSPLYDSRLVDKKGAGRWAYEGIKSSAQHCPFCSFGEVYEVDHFLPKTAFPELNICPSNLVPICHPCNHIKLESKPEGPDKYLLHPYFDVLPDIEWLFAELKFAGNGPSLHYRVFLDELQFGNIACRLDYHFSKLELDRRFKERAAQVLVELENDLTDHLDNLDPVKLMAHFKSEADRRFRNHGNSLEAAAYRAASRNFEYCSGRYRN